MVSIPSPFQSPATGLSPACPKVKLKSMGGDELFVLGLFVKSHCPVDGRKMPTVSIPSPFQSPTTGRSPACPKFTVMVVITIVGTGTQAKQWLISWNVG